MGLASGASLLNSCLPERQTEKIIPYLVPPDDGVIPGQALYTSTTCTECPAGCGISARTVDYQVGKLEGAAASPINDGALCLRGQASLSRLRHPDRIRTPLQKDAQGEFQEVSWDHAYSGVIGAMRDDSGRKNAYLSSRTTGSLSNLIEEFCGVTATERLPEFETFSYAAIREANVIVFGRGEVPSYRIDEADFLLTIGADVLETFVSPVSHATQLARAKKRPEFEWYHAEPHVSLTGMQAKHRFVVSPRSEPDLLAFLLRRVSRANLAGDRHIAGIVEALPNMSARGYAEKTGLTAEELDTIARHLLSAKRPLVISGGVSTMSSQGFETAVLTALLQWATGMSGSTIDFATAQKFKGVGTTLDLRHLSNRLDGDEVGVLFLSKVDLETDLPASIGLNEKIARATFRVGIGEFMTESMAKCDVILPLSNTLESWGDAEARHGLITVIQPVVEPIHDTRTEGDILIHLAEMWQGGQPVGTYQEYVFGQWNRRFGKRDVEKLLDQGYLGLPARHVDISLNRASVERTLKTIEFADASVKPTLVVAPSLRFFDGRGRDIPLAHEIPDPLTTITWGGWVSMSEESANELGAEERDEVSLSANGWSAELPVKIQHGMPRGVMTIQLGSVDRVPVSIDENTNEMVTTFEGVTVHYRWGIVIDLDKCVGCSACVSACYVENNVPVVGADLHLDGREMSWLRLEPFYEDGEAAIQPMLCQHCTNAPCEAVCPVFATYHNEDGMNAQIYNRCVGTRYCANNCPYKVRRFNWFDFKRPSEMNMTRNPEVSVRGKGVMEKCSFCVQRIRSARDTAKDEGRKIRDGEVIPACAQTCPTKAIVFGDLQDEHSEAHKLSRSSRVHRVFEYLNTDPAVYYLSDTWKNGKHHA
jgi:molybdopterin-containing oxidoreductase family iron-sulfur binding subunit